MPISSSQSRPVLRRMTRWCAVCIWCSLIFAASARPNLRVTDDDTLDLVLRKGAHIGVFAVLCALLITALGEHITSWRVVVAAAWIVSLAYACSDEWHQTFTEGRVGHVSDVGIDMVGATIAALIAAHFVFRRTARHEEDHE